jgi:hypothetical protein
MDDTTLEELLAGVWWRCWYEPFYKAKLGPAILAVIVVGFG